MEKLVDEAGKPISIKDDIFLISNHDPGKWDFTLSLSLSKGILKRKFEVFKQRLISVARKLLNFIKILIKLVLIQI